MTLDKISSCSFIGLNFLKLENFTLDYWGKITNQNLIYKSTNFDCHLEGTWAHSSVPWNWDVIRGSETVSPQTFRHGKGFTDLYIFYWSSSILYVVEMLKAEVLYGTKKNIKKNLFNLKRKPSEVIWMTKHNWPSCLASSFREKTGGKALKFIYIFSFLFCFFPKLIFFFFF